MVNGRETLRLRSKGAATVQEVVSFTLSAGKRLLMYSDSDLCKHKCTDTNSHTKLLYREMCSFTAFCFEHYSICYFAF